MNLLPRLGAALAFVLLGAHFHRAGALLGVAACAVALALLAWRQHVVVRVLQAALALGALEWAWTAFALVQQRQALGQPWGRLALILGTVALLTAAAAVALRPAASGTATPPRPRG